MFITLRVDRLATRKGKKGFWYTVIEHHPDGRSETSGWQEIGKEVEVINKSEINHDDQENNEGE